MQPRSLIRQMARAKLRAGATQGGPEFACIESHRGQEGGATPSSNLDGPALLKITGVFDMDAVHREKQPGSPGDLPQFAAQVSVLASHKVVARVLFACIKKLDGSMCCAYVQNLDRHNPQASHAHTYARAQAHPCSRTRTDLCASTHAHTNPNPRTPPLKKRHRHCAFEAWRVDHPADTPLQTQPRRGESQRASPLSYRPLVPSCELAYEASSPKPLRKVGPAEQTHRHRTECNQLAGPGCPHGRKLASLQTSAPAFWYLHIQGMRPRQSSRHACAAR